MQNGIIIAKDKCFGCAACAGICPAGCIEMERDREGFLYPAVDENTCIGCGSCERICPALHIDGGEKAGMPETYAFINENESMRVDSSSGGIFQLLAELIIKEQGAVFGAAFTGEWSVEHTEAAELAGIEGMRGSKYVQSNIGSHIYKEVKRCLLDRRPVLFTGTPCQIEGLNSYLGRKYDGLLLVDMICHGVPSPLVWKKYVEFRGCGRTIKKISFRDKSSGWNKFSMCFVYEDNTKYRAVFAEDPYIKGFLSDFFLRPVCYACPFKKKNRSSDITIADFWGVRRIIPQMYDGRGTSLVFLHTAEAKKIFSALPGRKCRADFENSLSYNPGMLNSAQYNRHRSSFFIELEQGRQPIDGLLKKYIILSETVNH